MIEMTTWHEKINPCFPSPSLPLAATVLLTRNTTEDALRYGQRSVPSADLSSGGG